MGGLLRWAGNPIRAGKKLEIAYGCITIGNDKIRVQSANLYSSSIIFQTDLEKGKYNLGCGLCIKITFVEHIMLSTRIKKKE